MNGDITIPIDMKNVRDEDYKELWKKAGPIEIKMVEKIGECKHDLGDVFYWETPYKRPEGVCTALLHVMELYTWRVVLGFPSWYDEDRSVYQIHCPDRTGTVWEMRKAEKE